MYLNVYIVKALPFKVPQVGFMKNINLFLPEITFRETEIILFI